MKHLGAPFRVRIAIATCLAMIITSFTAATPASATSSPGAIDNAVHNNCLDADVNHINTNGDGFSFGVVTAKVNSVGRLKETA